MGGGQQNKAHKRGRNAGLSARDKHKSKKDAGGRASIKSGANTTQRRADRLHAAKQARDLKRAAVLARRRAPSGPRVVAVVPLSEDVDVESAWRALLDACEAGRAPHSDGMQEDAASRDAPLVPVTVRPSESRLARFTLLPPPQHAQREDPLWAVDVGRSAQSVLLLMGPDGEVDAAGETALHVLRALGAPPALALVRSGADPRDMKARSAAKKAASAALARLLGGEPRVCSADGPADWAQALRQLAELAPTVPSWRQQRPQLLVEDAACEVQTDGACDLLLSGYVQTQGLSVRQAVHVPGAGDFAMSQLEELPEPEGSARRGGDAMDAAPAPVVLAAAEPSERATLDRENVPNPLAGEQTWPTEEELLEAEAARRAARATRRRRLPRGTSEYQAAWILDEDDGSIDAADDCDGDEDMEAPQGVGLAYDDEDDDADSLLRGAMGTEVDMGDGEESAEDEAEVRARIAERRHRERDDREFPDEVDTPMDTPARERFGKYRGLKSFRTSPWDPMESLPRDYARVFAFDNFIRTQKKAIAAASDHAQADALPGQFVRLHLCAVPQDAAQRVVERVHAWRQGLANPLSVFGLLGHETKLSVAHFALTPAPGAPVLASKEEVLLVTGLRAFRARPILSADDHGVDKHKMERFMHTGRPVVATVYAPISYTPLPAMAFQALGDGGWRLVASGSARRPDPDRIILKKIVLSGYPIRTHKSKAVVKYMFFSPDDIRWFKPVDLWTRTGRRGRIREPIGTHGAMKTVFDGPVNQSDSVCMSLYKRVFPKWPKDLTFADC